MFEKLSSKLNSLTSPSSEVSQPTIKFHILQGRNLAPKDLSGYSDPFVTIKLDKLKVKTKVIKKTLNPDWYEVLELAPDFSSVPTVIKLTCWDKDTVSKDFMGEIKLPILNLFNEDGTPSIFDDNPSSAKWYTLQRRAEDDTISGEIKFAVGFCISDDSQIQIIQSLYQSLNLAHSMAAMNLAPTPVENLKVDLNESASTINTESSDSTVYSNGNGLNGLLFIDVISATDLPWDKNATGTSFDMDPFVVVSLGRTTFKTSTIKHNLNPVWNERIVFPIVPDLHKFSIKFSVYDYDKFSSNDFVGSTSVSMASIVAASNTDIPSSTPLDEPAQRGKVFPLTLELTSQFLKERFAAQLLIRAEFLPYHRVRRDFWTALTKTYDTDSNNQMNKVEISTMLESLGSEVNDEIIDSFFTRYNKLPTDELSFDELAYCLEDITQSQDDKQLHHVLALTVCPICSKKLGQSNDLDAVSHIAVCASKDPNKIDRIVMGNFVTEANAQRKWFTKVASYVGYGEYKVGENNANIIVQDRKTGTMLEEKMPTYIKLGIRLLYKGVYSAAQRNAVKKVLYSMSVKQGVKFNDPASVREIEPFIQFHNLDREEILDPLDSFQNFNQFFYRKLKPSARQLASPDPKVAVSPADARVMVFPTIPNAQELWIKGEKFSIATLFDNKISPELAATYELGSLAIFRLAPQDYHRFHIPCDGTLSEPTDIEGQYYTVNPMAIRSTLDVYGENKRCFSFIDTEQFGKIAIVCIGAMMVGSIVLTSQPNAYVKRMDEHGYFAFGGSTILVLFQKGTIVFDEDLLKNSAQKLETLLAMGNSIGNVPL